MRLMEPEGRLVLSCLFCDFVYSGQCELVTRSLACAPAVALREISFFLLARVLYVADTVIRIHDWSGISEKVVNFDAFDC